MFKVIRLVVASSILMSCSVMGYEKDRRSLFEENIKGDCDTAMKEYMKVVYERDDALRELEYSKYSMSRYGNAPVSSSKIEARYEKANDDVTYYEKELLPISCPNSPMKR